LRERLPDNADDIKDRVRDTYKKQQTPVHCPQTII
jgi:hypothetical protein